MYIENFGLKLVLIYSENIEAINIEVKSLLPSDIN
jgi:hypothetical protein